MKYKIAFKKSVVRDLKKIGKQHSKRILDKIEKDYLKQLINILNLRENSQGYVNAE